MSRREEGWGEGTPFHFCSVTNSGCLCWKASRSALYCSLSASCATLKGCVQKASEIVSLRSVSFPRFPQGRDVKESRNAPPSPPRSCYAIRRRTSC
jgi:hypothetical protein